MALLCELLAELLEDLQMLCLDELLQLAVFRLVLINQVGLVSVVDLLAQLLDLLIQPVEVDVTPKHLLEDDPRLLEMEHWRECRHLLLDVEVQVQVRVHLNHVPVLWQLDITFKH